MLSPTSLGENPHLPLQPVVALGVPEIVSIKLQSLSLSSHGHLSSVSVSRFSSNRDTSGIGLQTHSTPVWPHPNLTNYVSNDSFLDMVTLRDTGVRTSTLSF